MKYFIDVMVLVLFIKRERISPARNAISTLAYARNVEEVDGTIIKTRLANVKNITDELKILKQ